MMQSVVFKHVSVRIPQKRIDKLFGDILKEESDKSAQGKINLIFTSDKNIRKFNKKYRGKDKATDVLSFNLEQPWSRRAVFGEIYISVETCGRQAKKYGGTLQEEFLRLICHGLLHLLGYDHIRAGDRRNMEEREKYFLEPFMAS